MTNNSRNPLVPLVIFFIILNGLFLSLRAPLDRAGFDQSVLIVGNLILFAATLLSFFFAKRGLLTSNANAFVRSVYLSIMIKLFLCMVAALVYIVLSRKNLNRPALFACMGLYLVYTFIEVSVLTRLLKERKHA